MSRHLIDDEQLDFLSASQLMFGTSKAWYGNYSNEVTEIGSSIPSGVICIWKGAANAIPSGWYLCNGQNGTPNLSGKFVIGYSSTYTVGKTGGEESHTLTTAEMPSHNHTFTGLTAAKLEGGDNGNRYYLGQSSSGTTGNAGSGNAHNNMPPYYALCYIMKA